MFTRVLLCYDGSESGRRALKKGAELAASMKATVHVLSITTGGESAARNLVGCVEHTCRLDLEGGARDLLDDTVSRLRARGITAEGHLAQGDTIDCIAQYARRLGCDLIVVGHYPTHSGRRWWSGSSQRSLAERVNCCVLIAMAQEAIGA